MDLFHHPNNSANIFTLSSSVERACACMIQVRSIYLRQLKTLTQSEITKSVLTEVLEGAMVSLRDSPTSKKHYETMEQNQV